jgi:hypothetical protein
MKKHLLLCIAVVLLTVMFSSSAGATMSITQNEYITAQSLDPGMMQAGVFFSIDRHYNSFYPVVRYGLGALFEVGAHFGAVTNVGSDEKNGAFAGVDLKYQIIKQTEGVPIDMAVDLGFDTILISRRNVSEGKFSTIFSRSFALMDRGYKLTPYGGLQVSALYGSFLSDDHVDVNVFAGLEWKISQKFMVLVEAKGGRTLVGGAGIKFEF